jgi:predicted GIY-YIG superfamily endonuclease
MSKSCRNCSSVQSLSLYSSLKRSMQSLRLMVLLEYGSTQFIYRWCVSNYYFIMYYLKCTQVTMTKRTRDDTHEFEKLAFGFAQTCKALGIEPDKEDVFKVFSLALDRTDNMSQPAAALDHLQSFLSTKCVHGSHSHSTIKVKDFMVAFSHYLKDRALPEMSSDEVLCELQAKGILQKLCTDSSVLALKDKMVFEGLNWVLERSPQEEDSDCCIYILALEQGKLYVGKTSSRGLDARMQAHYAGSACAWTRKYPVIKIVKLIPNCTAFDEDKETIRMMAEHGWRDVRGGMYCQIELSASDIAHIESSIRAATDKCMKCGSDQHL